MTKITLITLGNDVTANGLRIISSYLKQHGHGVELIFLNFPNDQLSKPVDEKLSRQIIELSESSDLVGFSLMTNHFMISRDLTVSIKKKLNVPIIWGGIHPTVKPDECLDYADMVCVGEGEEVMLELAEKIQNGHDLHDLSDIKNIHFKRDGVIVRNEVRLLESNLDKYPFQDYEIETHYVSQGNKIVRMTERLLEEAMPKNRELDEAQVEYCLISTRNCPHNCTFCCNNALRKIYVDKGKFVRKRSPEHIVREIESMKNRFPFIKQVLITDDTFFIRSSEEIKEFCEHYQQKVNLPFRCYCSPTTLDEEKLRLMVDVGLFRISMGVQSFSAQSLANIYKRQTPQDVIVEKVKTIDKFRDQIRHPIYHFIVDNPYETKEARKETLKFVLSLPYGSRIMLFPLVLYPGTELHEKAKKDGYLKNEIDDLYLKLWSFGDMRNNDYATCMLYLYNTLVSLSLALKARLPAAMIVGCLSREPFMLCLDNKIFLSLVTLASKLVSRFRPFLRMRRG